MALFNFDSEKNFNSAKIPAAKAINKQFCKKKGAAGLWIADDNMVSCGWKKTCVGCENDCCDHYIGTSPHIIQTSDDEISGRGIINPRILIIKRTGLLKLTEKGRYMGQWKKGDGEIKDELGNKKYTCVRRYLLLFLDDENKPLHTEAIQLTAKGTFQVDFDKKLMSFRNDIRAAYGKSMQRHSNFMSETWYAMCVFVPTFESKMVGKSGTQSYACAVKSYLVPDEDNWLSLCVGRDIEVNEIVYLMINDNEKWSKKYSEKFTEKDNNETEHECYE